MVTVLTISQMSAESYALRQCLRMIRHCLDTEERRRLCMALALREERAARMAEFRHRLWLVLARPWMTLNR
jgi:hypothetical protein